MHVPNHRPGTNPPLWPQVTSPRARELVQSAFDLSPLPHVNRPDEGLIRVAELLPVRRCDGQVMTGLEYEQWLRGRLAGSSLAMQLPGGIDSLPDILPQLPWFLRSLFRMTRPRSIPGLTRHVVNYLDWYLDPQQKISLRLRMGLGEGMVVFISTALTVLTTILFMTNAGASTSEIVAVLAGIAVLLAGLLSASALFTPIDHNKFTINASEFYYYVKDAFADRPTPPVADERPDIFKAW